jgi:diguanylate cyclase (GGDEF)-like protein
MGGYLPPIDAALFAIARFSFDGVALLSPNPWRFVMANTTLAGWLQHPHDELAGVRVDELSPLKLQCNVLTEALDQVWELRSAMVEKQVTLFIEGSNECSAVARVFALGDDTPLLGLVVRNLSRDSNVAASIRLDPLTDLPDRTFLLARLSAWFELEQPKNRDAAVLFVDLDNFKSINDSHGHHVGDRVLREVARRLKGCVRDGDHVTRYGGDEFVVLLENVCEREAIESVLDRIRTALAAPVALVDGQQYLPSVSIGVASLSPNHASPEDVLTEADRLMYAAKRRSGRSDAAIRPTC